MSRRTGHLRWSFVPRQQQGGSRGVFFLFFLEVKELFPNLADVPAVDLTTGGDGGARDVSVEDEEAGELGKPFTETEDDEEWTAWIDWGALGGGSSGTA